MGALLAAFVLLIMADRRSTPIRFRQEDGLDKAIRHGTQKIHYPTDGSHWQDHTGIGK